MGYITKLLIAVVCFLSLVGCAATPVGKPFKEVEASIPVLASGSGRIYFFSFENACYSCNVVPKIEVNGKNVGIARPFASFYIDLPAGNYEVEVNPGFLYPSDRRTISLDADETKYIEAFFQQDVLTYPSAKMIIYHPDQGAQVIKETMFFE